MPIVLAATLAAVTALQPSCSWDRPGVNPYRGNVRDALERYTDIPDADRIALKHRIEQGQADEQVEITRDAIRGKGDKGEYYPEISDMHFGAASVCHQVTRSKWDAARVEPGAVYCVKSHCILVPKICGNVSRIGRKGAHPVAVVEAKPSGSHARSRLGDALPGMELGLADADPVEISEEDQAQARERNRRLADQLAMIEAVAPEGAEEIPGEDDEARRNRLAGHYYSPFGDPGDEAYGRDPYDTDPTPVPEADSWAMLLAGLALLGIVGRRSRRAGR
jgi:hypothetical protein